jgi:two-component system sensor histidine kinase DegS
LTAPKVVPVAIAEPDDSIGASPLGSARYVVSQMISDLDVTAGHIAGRMTQAEAEREHLRDRFDEAEVIRHHVQNDLQRFQPTDVEQAFLHAAGLRADLAAVEERLRDLASRQAEAVEELEALHSVRRSLDDLAELDGTSVADGAARFRSASRQVFQIIEEERMRIARDMHDGPAQSMANLVLQAEVLERLVGRDPSLMAQELSDFKKGVRGALEETRRLIFDLRPMTLDDLGLVPTLRKFVREFGEKTGIDARFHVVGEERRLPQNYDAVLFRIVQEALANVRKHARAASVDVVVTMQARRVVAVVRDDGEGFDVVATEARQGRTRSLGLISMRERADLEKGSFEVKSQIGRGTEIRVVFDF